MTGEQDSLRAWLHMLSSANALKKSIDAKLREQYGLSLARFDVLAALERAGPDGLRAGALSQRLMVTEGNTTQVTAPLIRDGLIRRAPSRTDGRVAIFKLTKKGARLFDDMAAANRVWVAEAFSGLSPSQLAVFRSLLGKLNLPIESADAGKDAA